MKRSILLLIITVPLCGCTYLRGKHARVEKAVTGNEAKIVEESRALTTALVDVLSVAPTNQHTGLALEFARNDQQLEGLPTQRINVAALLAGQQQAMKELQARYATQQSLLEEKFSLALKLRETEARLIEMGKTYEGAQNRTIIGRFRRWMGATLGVGGIIALLILFPAIIPVVGSIVSWIVGKFPALAGFFGVVGKKAFDAVVLGVGNFRKELKQRKGNKMLRLVNTELHKATDQEHRRLIDRRRVVAGV